jgi:flavin reductase (DIM6/NTAB) family NADH-FMN oxidoreductase RutF
MTRRLSLVADPTSRSMPTAEFADAMSALASGVVLVTCRVGARPWGMTVTAFASASADPPTVLVALGTETASACAIRETGSFGVSILAADQLAVARVGSAPGRAKFLEPFVEPEGSGGASPAVAGALAHLDCELSESVCVADHTIVFGRVRSVRMSGAGAPLVYHGRSFRTLADPVSRPTEGNVQWLSS